MDTTATNTLAAYDRYFEMLITLHCLLPPHQLAWSQYHTYIHYFRIIACGDSTNECVVPGSAGVFRFDEEFGLDEKTTLQVSDHYPVFCHLRPTVHQTVRKYIQTRSAILVSDKVHRKSFYCWCLLIFPFIETPWYWFWKFDSKLQNAKNENKKFLRKQWFPNKSRNEVSNP